MIDSNDSGLHEEEMCGIGRSRNTDRNQCFFSEISIRLPGPNFSQPMSRLLPVPVSFN